MRSTVIILWICFIVLDMIISFGIAELWTRLFIPVQNTCYYHDKILGDMRCPNQKRYGYVEPGYSNILYTNDLGFHDIDRQQNKKPGSLRIHIYGDSFVSGIGVPISQTIPSQLEKYLNSTGFSIPVEVLNMATAEDSTCAELLAFRIFGKKFSPDVVILSFGADFRDNLHETHQRNRSPYFILNENNKLIFVPPVPVNMNSPVEKLKKSSMLIRLLANKILHSKFYHDITELLKKSKYTFCQKLSHEKHKESFQEKNEDFKKFTQKILANKSWPLTMKMLQVFKTEVKESGATFIIYDYIRFTPNNAGNYTNDDLKRFCVNNDIPYIRIYEEFEAIKNGPYRPKYILKDGHPTILGNQLLAKTIGKKIRPILDNLPVVLEYRKRKNDRHEYK